MELTLLRALIVLKQLIELVILLLISFGRSLIEQT